MNGRLLGLLVLLVLAGSVSAAGAQQAGHAVSDTQHGVVVGKEAAQHGDGVGAAGEAAEEHHAGSGAQQGGQAPSEPVLELPNFLHILEVYFGGPREREGNFINYLASWSGPFFGIAILLLIATLLLRGAAKRAMIPGRFQNAVEYVVEAFYNFVRGILGEHAREFAPFLGTLFLYIWLMNLAGLVPLLKAPTSAFETTLALALVVFVYVHVTGFRRLGVLGYLYHLVGAPRDVMGWCMVPLMLPLHIIGELAKPVSLSLRLFGNIMGEDVLIAVFTWLGVMTLAAIGSPVGLPLEFPFIFLGLLLSTIQALVFTLLSTIYFSQMLPHEEELEH
jgi:F-type H+-transporting ATPase subunit a